MAASQDIEKKRLRELALRAHFASCAAFTRFVEPSMENDVRAAANEAGVHAAFFGGYAGAERRIAAFYAGEAPEEWEYPLQCLELCWNAKFASPGHRDLLGAVMGLGLERDSIGDIALGAKEGTAYLFVHSDVESYACANLESAGRAKLSLKRYDAVPELRPPEGDMLRVTVSSERLDSVIAACYKLSRAEAQKRISSGLVKRNHAEELRGDIHLQAGDLISVRGMGRMRVEGFLGETKKGRLAVQLFRYKK